MFQPAGTRQKWESHRVLYGHVVRSATGAVLDEALLLFMQVLTPVHTYLCVVPLVPCVVPLVPCVVSLVPCVAPLVPCLVLLEPCVVPLVPCVVPLVPPPPPHR